MDMVYVGYSSVAGEVRLCEGAGLFEIVRQFSDSPDEPTGPREARPDDRLRDIPGPVPNTGTRMSLRSCELHSRSKTTAMVEASPTRPAQRAGWQNKATGQILQNKATGQILQNKATGQNKPKL
jgi:hypothetical protein